MLNNRADAQLCETQHHARSDEPWSVVSCRKIGTPIENTSLSLLGVIQTEARDEDPEWMNDCVHTDESLDLVKRMSNFLGFRDADENVIETVLNEYVKDNELYGILEIDDEDPDEIAALNEQLKRGNPLLTHVAPEFRYNGHYFIVPPIELHKNEYMHHRTIRTRSKSREEQERLERERSGQQSQGLVPSTSRTINRIVAAVTGTPVERTNRDNPVPEPHVPRTRLFREITQCNTRHTPQKVRFRYSASTLVIPPVHCTMDDYATFLTRRHDYHIAETYELVETGEPGQKNKYRRAIRIKANAERENSANNSIGSLELKFLNRKTIHSIVASRIRLGSVIYIPPGGGKSTMAFQFQRLGIKILDTGMITEWNLPRKDGILDCTDYLVVTNNLHYAVNSPNALYVLPCKDIYMLRGKAKHRSLAEYSKLKEYVKLQAKRPGHQFLQTDLHLSQLPWTITYKSPNSFNQKRISDATSALEFPWCDSQFTSFID